MPAKTETAKQVNLWVKSEFVEMLDQIVEDDAGVCPSSRAIVFMTLIGKEFRRRKLNLDKD